MVIRKVKAEATGERNSMKNTKKNWCFFSFLATCVVHDASQLQAYSEGLHLHAKLLWQTKIGKFVHRLHVVKY